MNQKKKGELLQVLRQRKLYTYIRKYNMYFKILAHLLALQFSVHRFLLVHVARLRPLQET
jgi:hypothetical protein